MMKRIAFPILCLIFAALVLLGCGRDTQAEPAAPSPSQSSAASAPAPTAKPADTQPSPSAETISPESSPSAAPEEAPSYEIENCPSKEEAMPLQFGARYHGKADSGEVWVSFTTSGADEAEYTLTATNLKTGSDKIVGFLFDESGVMQKADVKNNSNLDGRCIEARDDGAANSGIFTSLEPDTVYYLRLDTGDKSEYSLRLTGPDGDPFDVTETMAALSPGDAPEPASNMDSAPLLPFNARYRCAQTDGYTWAAFKTGSAEEAEYTVTVENLKAGSDKIVGYLYDEFGFMQKAAKKDNSNLDGRCIEAKNDGTANSAVFDSLLPDSVYYLILYCSGKAEYVVTFGDAAGPDSNITGGDSVVPGTSQSYSLMVPLGTKVFSKYTDGYAWLAFTTTDAEEADYYVTVTNCTVGSEDIVGFMVDKLGTVRRPAVKYNSNLDGRCIEADWDGTANSSIFSDLLPNTTYYVRLNCRSKAEYSLVVSSPGQEAEGGATSSNLTEAIGAIGENETFYTGTNQNAATLLKHNVTYHGKYEDGYAWVAFTTGDLEEAEYTVTVENLKADSESMVGYLFDEFGILQKAAKKDNSNLDGRCIEAKNDGTANTGMFNTLLPDTTYYLRLNCRSKTEYLITIGAPEPKESGNTIEEAPVEEEVFPVAFELNETQVRFVADEAIFIDEDEAAAVLAPVAEIILAHPGQPILLAGTTAHGQSQERCVDLSFRRAEAVKKLLTEKFGVPADQLLTAGLGFEDDPFVRGRDIDSDGNFVETEAAKNRRVVILNAESETAKKILDK